MARELALKVNIRGLRETIRAFNDLPKDASNELRDGSMRMARALAPKAAAAARSEGAQAAAAAPTVKARRDRVPVIVAGGAKRVTKNRARAGDLVAGAEFGANGRYGWYRAGRYGHSHGRQYKPHQGAASYWFFRTFEAAQPEIEREWLDMADAIIRKWAH